MRLAIACLAAMAVAVTGCGDDESTDATTPGSASTAKTGTTTSSKAAKPPAAIPLSEDAKEAGARACRDLEPKEALTRFAASAKKAGFDDVATARKGLLAQARQLRKAKAAAGGAETSGVTVAAGLYAISQPRAQRGGAYQGCLQEMIRAQGPPG